MFKFTNMVFQCQIMKKLVLHVLTCKITFFPVSKCKSVLQVLPCVLPISVEIFLKEIVGAPEQQHCIKLGLQVLSIEASLITLHICSASSWGKKIKIKYK